MCSTKPKNTTDALTEARMSVRNFVLLVVVAVLAGCSTTYFTYKGETFASRDEALAAIQADIDLVLNGTEARPAPVANRARVVIPSIEAILERGLRVGGSSEHRDYVSNAIQKQIQLIPTVIKKRNIFKRVDVEETNSPDLFEPTPGIITVYRYLSVDGKSGSWYYASQSTPRAPLRWDMGESDFVNRYRHFLDSIEALAVSEAGK
jgi:hypothetical protein